MKRSTLVLWLVCMLALLSSEAHAQELFAQMYRCMPIPKAALSTTPSFGPYGATADERLVEVQFSYAVAAEHADDVPYRQAAASAVEWVEVCAVRTEPAPTTWSCPWTEDPMANASWLVYHDTLKPAGNEPKWLEVETDRHVTGRERYCNEPNEDAVPVDWRSESESRKGARPLDDMAGAAVTCCNLGTPFGAAPPGLKAKGLAPSGVTWSGVPDFSTKHKQALLHRSEARSRWLRVA